MINRTKKITARSPEDIAKAIGLTGADSKEWQVQYALLKHLQHVVRDEGLTHAEVARRGGSSRTRVTAILNGNLDKVSSDLLIRLLGALGYRVKVSVTRVNTAA
jgi:predicted XRE-type DNA-binding protein